MKELAAQNLYSWLIVQCTPIPMDGGTPAAQAKLGGSGVVYAVDSGSMGFLPYIQWNFSQLRVGTTIRANANPVCCYWASCCAHEMPWTRRRINRARVPTCGVLVLKNTPTTAKKKLEVPGVLEPNAPSHQVWWTAPAWGWCWTKGFRKQYLKIWLRRRKVPSSGTPN